MDTSKIATLLLLTSVAACGGAPPGPATDPATIASPSSPATTKPASAAAKLHLEKHVKYPATRAEILAACADTNEFTEAEKHWFSSSLPEGTYASAADVEAALKL
jgi:hypothetical protein